MLKYYISSAKAPSSICFIISATWTPLSSFSLLVLAILVCKLFKGFIVPVVLLIDSLNPFCFVSDNEVVTSTFVSFSELRQEGFFTKSKVGGSISNQGQNRRRKLTRKSIPNVGHEPQHLYLFPLKRGEI